MQEFKVRYIPGGMYFVHSAWWLYCNDEPIKFLRRSAYE